MKHLTSMKILALLLIINLSFPSCSDDDPQGDCYQDENRNIIRTIAGVEGTIEASSCSNNFIIEPDDKIASLPLGLFDPCNLSSEFEIDGARIIFSGFVYESFETEDICADFFEITEIKFIEP